MATGTQGLPRPGPGLRKGARTRARILDAAERCFAEKGFAGASLREIAAAAGIREPGLYNHFAGKRALYAAVLDRALQPLATLLERAIQGSRERATFADLPGDITDLLARHPRVSALFQQALQGGSGAEAAGLLDRWLDRLFAQGMAASRSSGRPERDRAEVAIGVIAMFNLCTGYFLSQRAFDRMAEGSLGAPENLVRQKRLLSRMVRAVV